MTDTGTRTEPEEIPEAEDQEERRRSDFWVQIRNSALQYIGVAWFLTQVFAVMGTEFGWPAGVSNWMIIILGIGFVLAMVGSFIVAWRDRVSRSRRHRRGLAIALITGIAADRKSVV